MINTETLAEKIFSLLKGNQFQIKIYDELGAETVDPKLGRRFFVASPNLMITLNDDTNSIEISKGKSAGDKVDLIQKNIRRLANEFQMNSSVKIFGKSIQPRDYAYQAKMKMNEHMNEGFGGTNSLMLSKVFHELDYAAGMTAQALADSIPGSDLNDVQKALNALEADGKVEIVSYLGKFPVYGKTMVESSPMKESIKEGFSRMFGSKRVSKQVLENVRILVKHKSSIDESVPGARSRQIEAIFLECNGERFRFPHNYLLGARAMASHISQGGTVYDKIGTHITESTGNLLKLQSFNRYVTNNRLINEDSNDIVDTVRESIEVIRKDLKKFTGKKTYESIKTRIETYEKQTLEEDDISQLKDIFTIRRFDEKVEEVLPIVKQLMLEKDSYLKRIEEAAAGQVFVNPEKIDSAMILEFTSENARLGYKISELGLRILENEELSKFVSKVGNKISKEGKINTFERAIISQVIENSCVRQGQKKKTMNECQDLEAFFDKFDFKFL